MSKIVKIVKNAILLLSLFVLILIPITQVAQAAQTERKFSVSFKPSSPQNNLDLASKKDFSEQGTSAASLVISHGSVSYSKFSDYNGNGHYRRTVCWFDIDSDKKINYYIVFYFNNNEGYGWYTNDGLKSDVYTIDGYSPEDGVYIENLYWMGSKEATEGVKIELYSEDGVLMDTYGPDDNPDLGNIKIESIEYDVKRNPFANPSPKPSPAPTPDDAKITGYVVNNGGDSVVNAKVVARKDGETIASVSSDDNGEFVLEGLETGRYELLVSKKGYRKKVVTVVIEDDGGDEKIVIELKKKR